MVHFYAQPITYARTGLFWKVTRAYDLTPDGEGKIMQMESFIRSQDQAHVSKQRPWEMPPMPIRRVDEALIKYPTTTKSRLGIIPRL